MTSLILLLSSLAHFDLSIDRVEAISFSIVAGDSVGGLSEQQQRIEQMGAGGVIYFDAPLSTHQQTLLR